MWRMMCCRRFEALRYTQIVCDEPIGRQAFGLVCNDMRCCSYCRENCAVKLYVMLVTPHEIMQNRTHENDGAHMQDSSRTEAGRILRVAASLSKALYRTATPLRSIVASELGRYM